MNKDVEQKPVLILYPSQLQICRDAYDLPELNYGDEFLGCVIHKAKTLEETHGDE